MAGKMQRQELPETGKECSAAASKATLVFAKTAYYSIS
jgi:hypothetical protein